MENVAESPARLSIKECAERISVDEMRFLKAFLKFPEKM